MTLPNSRLVVGYSVRVYKFIDGGENVIRPDKDPPYNLPRTAIEKAIKADGFQLWRLKSKLSPPA